MIYPKYRYWDSVIKQFVFSEQFDFANQFVALSHFFRKAAIYAVNGVEQFTGIQDSQRKDIYEGDIVETVEYYDKDCVPVEGMDTYLKQWEVYKGDGYFAYDEDNPHEFVENVSLKLVKGAVPWNTHVTVVSHIHLNDE